MACAPLGGDEYYPAAAEITTIRVSPDPAKPNELVTFTIELVQPRADLIFKWNLAGPGDIVTTSQPTLQWLAPPDIGVYDHQVEIERTGDYETVGSTFSVTVAD